MRYEAQSFRTFLRCLKTLTELQENTLKIEECGTNPIIDFPEKNQSPADQEVEPAELSKDAGITPAAPHSLDNIPVSSDSYIPSPPSENHEQ
jgi:hypothetical protein